MPALARLLFRQPAGRMHRRQRHDRAAFETAWRVFLYKRSEAGLARPRGVDHGEVPPPFTTLRGLI